MLDVTRVFPVTQENTCMYTLSLNKGGPLLFNLLLHIMKSACYRKSLPADELNCSGSNQCRLYGKVTKFRHVRCIRRIYNNLCVVYRFRHVRLFGSSTSNTLCIVCMYVVYIEVLQWGHFMIMGTVKYFQ